jgi:hypothetical protein
MILWNLKSEKLKSSSSLVIYFSFFKPKNCFKTNFRNLRKSTQENFKFKKKKKSFLKEKKSEKNLKQKRNNE